MILTYCATLVLPYLCTPTDESCLSFELSRQSPSVSKWFFDTLRRPAQPGVFFALKEKKRSRLLRTPMAPGCGKPPPAAFLRIVYYIEQRRNSQYIRKRLL